MLVHTNQDMSSNIRSDRMEGINLFAFNTKQYNKTNSEKRRY